MRARWGWLAAALLCGSALAAPLTAPFGFPPGVFQNRAALDAASGPVNGQALGLAIPSANFTSITDLTLNQFINGWTGDLTLKGMSPAGVTSAYNCTVAAGCPNYTSPLLTVAVTRPGYTAAATTTTVAATLQATGWLRQTSPNSTLPTEAASGSNAQIGLTFSDYLYASDAVGVATLGAGLYTSGIASLATNNVPVTNNSTRTYPRPIGAWVTEPGLRIAPSASQVVEFFAGHAYGQGGAPVAAVKFTATDGTNSVVHTISSVTQSARLWSTTCTATNGSNVLTSCGDTTRLIKGERLTIAGIPGQPEVLSWTSTAITLGQTVAASGCTPKTNGEETITGTPGDGEGLGDGAFVGAKISDPNLGTNPATITAPVGVGTNVTTTLTLASVSAGQFDVGQWLSYSGEPAGTNMYISALIGGTGGAGTYTIHCAATCPQIPAATTITGSAISANPGGTTVTSIKISTNATSGTATANACTVQHVYQGSTETVTVTLGNPVPVYAATFSGADLASLNNGVIWFRAQVYPIIGDVILDTLTGADGTGCDWWYINVNSGVCNSSSAAWFGTNNAASATVITPNLHNLWAYNDQSAKYPPIYAWVSGSAGGGPAVSTSAADPGSAAYYATISAAVTAIKTYNNAHNSHNDANAGVICLTSAGSPYTTTGGAISANFTVNEPPLTITSTTASGNCPATGSVNANITGVTLGGTNTAAPPFTHVNNLTLSAGAASLLQGVDSSKTTTALASSIILEDDLLLATAAYPELYQFGTWWWYNSFIDQSAHNGYVLAPYSVNGIPALVAGNTISCGTFTANASLFVASNEIGNDMWGCSPAQPTSNIIAAYNTQAISSIVSFNKMMGVFNPPQFQGGGSYLTPQNNLLLADDIIEMINQTAGAQPALQISADNVNVPNSNIIREYSTIGAERTNIQYVEGIPTGPLSLLTTGGSLSGGAGNNYYVQLTESCVTGSGSGCNSSTETATDGQAGPFSNGTTNSTASMSVPIPCDPSYKYNVYVGTSTTITHPATVAGADAIGLASCQVVVITAISATSRTPPAFSASFPAHNEFKTAFFQRFNIDTNFNIKGDLFGPSSGTNGPNGARIGNWEGRFNVGDIGNIATTGSFNGSTPSPSGWLGDVVCQLCAYGSSTTDLSLVTYQSDRGFGSNQTNPTYPALNIGQGDYCPASSTNVGSRVPSGLAAYPWDIQGNTRKNDGTGYAGAYETGCN